MSLKYTGDYYKDPNLKINQYLEEEKDSILEKIYEFDRLLLIAPTGSGKSHLIISNTEELLRTYEKIIFVVPLLPLQAEFDSKWETDLSINHNKAKISIEDYDTAKRVTTTYRSLYKISKYFDHGTLVVLDEFHTVFNDNLAKLDEENKNRNIKAIEQTLVSDVNIVGMTATPQIFITRSIGFEPFIVSFNTSPYIRNISIRDIPMFPSFMLARINHAKKQLKAGCKLFIYYKNIKKLEYFFKAFDSKGKYIDSYNSVITSDKLRSNEEGFNDYLKRIFSEFNIIFSTNAITTGLSIEDDNVSNILVFDVTESDEIIQLMSRFRNVKTVAIDIFLNDKAKRKGKKYLHANDLNEMRTFCKNIREKIQSDFNYGVLTQINHKQTSLVKERYHSIDKKQLKKEIDSYKNFGISIELYRSKKAKLNLNDKDVRKKFFSYSDAKLRLIIAIDAGIAMSILENSTHSILKKFGLYDDLASTYPDYYIAVRAFSDSKFHKISSRYFSLLEIDYKFEDSLLDNWHYLTSTNISNIEIGMIGFHIYNGFIRKDRSPDRINYSNYIVYNYPSIYKVYNKALSTNKFKEMTFKDDSFYNKHLLHIDNKTKIRLIQKSPISIVRSIFKISTKGKGKKLKDEYFHYFEQPTFENAKEFSEDRTVYAKEGNNDVLYVYDWDKTRDNLILQKELSKVLVSKKELIKNILNK